MIDMSTLKPLIEANALLQENTSLKKDIKAMTTMMGIAALLTIVSAYYSYENRKLTKKVNDELRQKNKENY